jgi:phage tail P2-like protein
MSDAHALTAENLLRTLPDALKNDSDMIALASTISDALAARPAEIKGIMIYPRIGKLDEDLLDILAYDLKVDWYDYSASLDIKRKVMLNAPRVRRTIGTPGAVKRAIRAMLPNTELTEWFNDTDEQKPYTFSLSTTDTLTPEIADVLPSVIAYTKNVRSHLSAIHILREYAGNCYLAVGMQMRPRIVIENVANKNIHCTAQMHTAVAMHIGHSRATFVNKTNVERVLHSAVHIGTAQTVKPNVAIANGMTLIKSVQGQTLVGTALAVQTHITIKGE